MKIRLLGIIFAVIFSSMLVGDAHGSISFDKADYTWTDKINIRITEHGVDADGSSIKIYTYNHELDNYKLSKTGNGLYTGKIILTGFLHDVTGDGKPDTNPRTTGNGPNNGFLESQNSDELKIYVKFGDGSTISKSVQIRWNMGSLGFDMPAYSLDEFAKLHAFDADMNLNPETLDKLPIHVYSDSDKAGILVDAIETQEESGIFETVVTFTSQHDSSGDRLFAAMGDSVYAKYTDYTLPAPYNMNDNHDILVESKIIDESDFVVDYTSTADVLKWSLSSYFGNENGIIQVIDSDMNLNEDRIDTFDVQVWSESDPDGINLILVETNESTGVFEGTVTFTTSDESSGHRLRVFYEDIIQVRYVDGMQSIHTTIDDKVISANTEIKKSHSSPLKQKELGISSENIVCKTGMKKIFKHDDSAVCVKPLTAEKLIQRGWIKK